MMTKPLVIYHGNCADGVPELIEELHQRANDYALNGRSDTALICNRAATALTALYACLCPIDIEATAAKHGYTANIYCDQVADWILTSNVELTGSRAGSSPVSPATEGSGVERRVGDDDAK